MHERWAKPELPRHEQFLTSGMPDASGPSPRQSQQQHDEDDEEDDDEEDAALISEDDDDHSADGIVITSVWTA